MFHQLLTPIGSSLLPSFLVSVLPIFVVLVLLGWARRPAWQASLAGPVVGLLIAIIGWHFPVVPGLVCVAGRGAGGRGVPLLAGDGDRRHRDPAVQHRAVLGPLRRVPHVDDR